MNRDDLCKLADERVADAAVLLGARRWPAAYYLLGYAIECALKACASRQFREHEIPEKKLVNALYTHAPKELLELSGKKTACEARVEVDRAFGTNWSVVKDWSETSRYDPLTTESKARDMYAAVTDPKTGVLPWLKTVW